MPDQFAQDGSWDVLDNIQRIIDERVTYLKIFDATVLVNVDPISPSSGRVLVASKELGWNDPITASWAEPDQVNSLIVPAVGDEVYLRFIGADPDRPVYFGKAHEFTSGIDHDGDPFKSTLFESNLLKDTITHDDKLGKFVFNATGLIELIGKLGITLGAGTDPMVKGTALLTFLTTLVIEINAMVTVFNTHIHPGVTPGPGSTGPTPSPQVTVTAPSSSSILSVLNKLD